MMSNIMQNSALIAQTQRLVNPPNLGIPVQYCAYPGMQWQPQVYGPFGLPHTVTLPPPPFFISQSVYPTHNNRGLFQVPSFESHIQSRCAQVTGQPLFRPAQTASSRATGRNDQRLDPGHKTRSGHDGPTLPSEHVLRTVHSGESHLNTHSDAPVIEGLQEVSCAQVDTCLDTPITTCLDTPITACLVKPITQVRAETQYVTSNGVSDSTHEAVTSSHTPKPATHFLRIPGLMGKLPEKLLSLKSNVRNL